MILVRQQVKGSKIVQHLKTDAAYRSWICALRPLSFFANSSATASFVRWYRVFGILLCLAGVLVAVDSIVFSNHHH
jgi:hypothetical protein